MSTLMVKLAAAAVVFIGVVLKEDELPVVGLADVPEGTVTDQEYVAPDVGVALKFNAVPLHCVPVGAA